MDELHAVLLANEAILNSEMPGTVLALEKKEKRTQPPKLYSLYTLQTVVNKKWKYSPAIVLKTMQSLYEKKLVTYPRTDTNFLNENEFKYLVRNTLAMFHKDYRYEETKTTTVVNGIEFETIGKVELEKG